MALGRSMDQRLPQLRSAVVRRHLRRRARRKTPVERRNARWDQAPLSAVECDISFLPQD